MSEMQEEVVVNPTMTEKDKAAKTNALIAYGLMLVGLFTGFLTIIGIIWAMVKKGDAQGTIFADHYSNIITTFWWFFGLSILGVLLIAFFVGYLLLFAVWIWFIFRMVKGLAKLTSNKGYNG
ncbi:hypothetical protein [Photobacterium sp. GB-1]|uniref:DUF4870 family protein n=1 Tax=Photobacterium sp. GB-1 TaxID=2022111 RepID=UPI000D157E4C|nr:hypothetical protein [Photobacterium sp. GB-1]PSV55012.1 hypothetical protein C9J45_00230 [Photobacterium sp. GB-1]